MDLRADHCQVLSKFLTIRELCRLIQVSRKWFHLWIDDRSWLHQEQRVCACFPELKYIFDELRTSEEAKKRHKKEWVVPRKGTWWTFKRWLYMGCSMDGIKKMCNEPRMHPLVFSVVKTSIPFPKKITSSTIIKCDKTPGKYYMFRISFWKHDGSRCTYIIKSTLTHFETEYYGSTMNTFYNKNNSGIHSGLHHHYALLLPWTAFLFQRHEQICWTPFFEQLMKE
jgi:predicted DNA-binding transcriptional regulator AlpA